MAVGEKIEIRFVGWMILLPLFPSLCFFIIKKYLNMKQFGVHHLCNLLNQGQIETTQFIDYKFWRPWWSSHLRNCCNKSPINISVNRERSPMFVSTTEIVLLLFKMIEQEAVVLSVLVLLKKRVEHHMDLKMSSLWLQHCLVEKNRAFKKWYWKSQQSSRSPIMFKKFKFESL